MRLFVAFTLPDAVCRDLDRRTQALRPRLPAARWVRPEAMHLTLAFLGDTPPEKLADLDRELKPAFAAFQAMVLRVEGVGGFPSDRPSRVVWAGLEADGDILGLQAAVAAAVVRALGKPLEDGRFHPHVALARCQPPWPLRAVEVVRGAFASALPPPFPVLRGTLYESHLKPTGAEYRVVSEYPLGAEKR